MHRPSIRFRILLIPGVIAYLLILGEVVYRLSLDLTPRQSAILKVLYGLVALLFIVTAIILSSNRKMEPLQCLGRWYQRCSGWALGVRIALYGLLILAPIFATFSGIDRGTLQNLWFRALILIPVILAAALVSPFPAAFSYGRKVLATLIALSFAYGLALQAHRIVNYPFSLTWSEGNRLYDYSTIFGKSRYHYDGDLRIPYYAPGRYGLWGIWFLSPNLPIWFHRLWDAVLWLAPSVALGWLCTRAIREKTLRWVFTLWIAIFLYQGPIYAPLVLAAVWVLLFNQPSMLLRTLAVGSASTYLGLSRWTWSPAAGMWGVLVDLCLYYPSRKGSWLRRIAPTVLLGMAGSLPGLGIHWRRFVPASISGRSGTSLESSQPLLWYRLLPNASYSVGILLGIVIATLPVVVILAWLAVSRRWRLPSLASLAVIGAIAGSLAVGLVISAKIGGGGDLHNLDMYFVTLVMLVMVILERVDLSWQSWPATLRLIALVAILVPAWNLLRAGEALNLPPRERVDAALQTIRSEVDSAAGQGEVLFMDQRQLLTFGAVGDIELVPDYEKKFVMDQALAANQAYFEGYYQDLENKRFVLIVTEPLSVRYQDRSYTFSEENNAWMQWVAKPTLCYYRTKLTLPEVGVQLLVPRYGAPDCR